MRPSLLESVSRRVLVGDGAMGTELMKRGLPGGASPELWNLEQASHVLAVHDGYLQAGADFIHTNTLGANRWQLERHGLGASTARINAAAAQIARNAAEGEAFVIAEIGPTGRLVAPLGEDSPDDFVCVFAEQAAALADAGVDAFLLETFTAVPEALAALEAAKAQGLPVIASMSYSPDARGTFRTVMGEPVGSATAALETAGADIIAANCGLGADQYVDLAAALAAAARRPVMVQPNAGMPKLVQGRTVFPMTPEEFASHVEAILDAGVRVVGGCCGTTPEHIRAVRKVVDSRS